MAGALIRGYCGGRPSSAIELIAAGEAVAIVAGSHAAGLRRDRTTVPLDGVEPCHVVLATRAGDRNRLVAQFRKIAEAHLSCR